MQGRRRLETKTVRVHAKPRDGALRGAASAPPGRYQRVLRERVDDGWWQEPQAPGGGPPTTVTEERAGVILARNDSPDIPFDRSVNPYRGCEHGCVYCYARPSHAWLELSPGLDFETCLYAKTNAVDRLREALARPGYVPAPIAFGTNTDAYQPVERRYRLMRGLLGLLGECSHPYTIVTKSALVERDLDLIAPMAARNMARVWLSITTLDEDLARRLEPRAASPRRRLDTLRALAAAGVPAGVMVAPVVPGLTDKSIEEVLQAAREAGATDAGTVLLRLPHELKTVFRDWLEAHVPLRAAHVMHLVRASRGGRDNDPRYGHRMTGEGPLAELYRRRFEIAARRLGLDGRAGGRPAPPLDCSRFRPPARGPQLELFR